MQKATLRGITVDKLLQTAEMFKGFKKQPSVLKQLDGKYYKAGREMKRQGITSASVIREMREVE